ncbi:MAG: non-canonical purine NTP pyrophosphatase [archaeon]|nr:MAG: non-canonical purine NTP pyrophosphatase [archaeon]
MFFITGNKGKLEEVKDILGDVEQLEMDLPEVQGIDAREIVRAKLTEAQKHRKGDFIVEDTSLYLDCLNGLPGPLIKWFLKTVGNEGLFRIAERLGEKGAEARTIVGLAKDGEIFFFEGSLKGKITEPRGTGFGWDPVFQPKGSGKTFGELSKEEKNSISMRRKALEKLRDFLTA